MQTIRVLIVDDSVLFREFLKRGISKDPAIEVVGFADDPYDARDKIIELHPDVLSLDIEMPKMNGIDFLKRLMPQYPMPVVVVSAISDKVFDALSAGAVDFVTKPDGNSEEMLQELITKIKIASISKVAHWRKSAGNKGLGDKVQVYPSKINLIAIGASTGGTDAVFEVLKHLPSNSPPILIVQHMPKVFTKLYAERIDKFCNVRVKEATNLQLLEPGLALIAPGDMQMKFVIENHQRYVRCGVGEKVNGHAPSVDVLFQSIAKYECKAVAGLILTGMGADGAKGLLEMKNRNAVTIGQDQETSVVYGMPKVAFDIGAVDYQLPLPQISQKIIQLLSK
jgi:two-component system chemotaxis response regulator CheB